MAKPRGGGRSLDAHALRRSIGREEFDYISLMEALRDYASPRDKVTDLLRRKDVVRVKKGLYVFGPEVRLHPYSLEILANTIYGPSYISMEYALAHHGLIPEGVVEVTSASLGRSKRFATPVGRFSYRPVPQRVFWMGVDRIELGHSGACLMATPEKALADALYLARRVRLTSQEDMRTYLVDSLRIEGALLSSMNSKRINAIADRYRSARVSLLAQTLPPFKREARRE
ncbi:MAG: hypothetical protein P8018_09975 [Acidobacteriota bacterium]